MSEALFAGLKVLDVGTWIAGPVSATILADFGADVIKIEQPGVGDQYRILSALPGFPDAENNYMWDMDARNKRSLALNLKTPEGIEILHQLVRDCDVYITNQPFPMRDALKLNYDDLKPLNPSMIYASLSAYGESGPDRNEEGFDLVAYWARTGLADLVHDATAPPGPAIPGMGDHPTAVSLYAGIVTALLRKERTGEGAHVHTSLMANGLWSASCVAQAGLAGGNYDNYRQLRSERRFPLSKYRAADDRYFLFTMVRSDEELDRFAECLGRPGLFSEPPFDTPEGRFMNAGKASTIIDDLMAQKTSSEWIDLFKQQNLKAVLVGRVEELPDDPQIDANHMAPAPVSDEVHSKRVINHPINISSVPSEGAQPAPDLGEHSEEILAGMGYDAQAIDQLRRNGVI